MTDHKIVFGKLEDSATNGTPPIRRMAMCGCGHGESKHNEIGCCAWVFGVPTAASAGRCSCSQFIGDGADE